MKDSTQLVWFTVPSDFFWDITVTAFRVGTSLTFSDGSTSAYKVNIGTAIVDTGTTMIYLPKCKLTCLIMYVLAIGATIMKMILKG